MPLRSSCVDFVLHTTVVCGVSFAHTENADNACFISCNATLCMHIQGMATAVLTAMDDEGKSGSGRRASVDNGVASLLAAASAGNQPDCSDIGARTLNLRKRYSSVTRAPFIDCRTSH
jgi:hypothetical protein